MFPLFFMEYAYYIYIYHDISYHDNNVICGYHPYIRVYILIYIYRERERVQSKVLCQAGGSRNDGLNAIGQHFR